MTRPIHPSTIVEHLAVPPSASPELKRAVSAWNEAAPAAMAERCELHAFAERVVNAELELCERDEFELAAAWSEIRTKDEALQVREQRHAEMLAWIRERMKAEEHTT